jgi:hypothetical protein
MRDDDTLKNPTTDLIDLALGVGDVTIKVFQGYGKFSGLCDPQMTCIACPIQEGFSQGNIDLVGFSDDPCIFQAFCLIFGGRVLLLLNDAILFFEYFNLSG